MNVEPFSCALDLLVVDWLMTGCKNKKPFQLPLSFLAVYVADTRCVSTLLNSFQRKKLP